MKFNSGKNRNSDKNFEKNEVYHSIKPGPFIEPTSSSTNTQTRKTKGTGAAIKGTNFSKNSQ